MSDRKVSTLEVLIKIGLPVIFILIMVITISMGGCTDAEKATNLLQSQGYSQVEMTGYSWFACGKGDYWRTGFKAKSPNGVYTEGTVCEGIFKGQTIRFD